MGSWPGVWEFVLPVRQSTPGLFTYQTDITLHAKLQWTTPEQDLVISQDRCFLPRLLSEAHSSPREL